MASSLTEAPLRTSISFRSLQSPSIDSGQALQSSSRELAPFGGGQNNSKSTVVAWKFLEGSKVVQRVEEGTDPEKIIGYMHTFFLAVWGADRVLLRRLQHKGDSRNQTTRYGICRLK